MVKVLHGAKGTQLAQGWSEQDDERMMRYRRNRPMCNLNQHTNLRLKRPHSVKQVREQLLCHKKRCAVNVSVIATSGNNLEEEIDCDHLPASGPATSLGSQRNYEQANRFDPKYKIHQVELLVWFRLLSRVEVVVQQLSLKCVGS